MKARTQQEAQKQWSARKASELSRVGRFLCTTGAISIYGNGEHFDQFHRWWHPITWLIFAVVLLVAPFVAMFTSFTVISIFELFPCRPVKYFRDNPDQLFFVK